MRKAVLAVVLVLAVPGSAFAANCTVLATGIMFGTYNPVAPSSTENAGSLTVTCSATNQLVQYSIAMNAGQHSGGNFFNRRLSNGRSVLSYQLYTNPIRTTVWGDGGGGTSIVSDSYSCNVCLAESRTYTTYGRLTGQQFSAGPGAYLDGITVTVTFH